jgi:hypothetical protein
MGIDEYLKKWDKKELNTFSPDDFKDFNIHEETKIFLVTIGLPDSAAPFLSFDRKELKTIRQIYHTENPDDELLIDIGSDGAGDPICIDTKNKCQIVALDHEDDFAMRFMNSSIMELFAFLTIYKEFGEKLRQLRGQDAFVDSNCTDEEIEELIRELKLVDVEALKNQATFWSQEIGMFKANRDA